ncbi:MAG TPA: neutral/alkaline non-lysosomal ceramidase N-terminal domain-containing protein [Abditibacteriaceae bacterium]|nr:neutral/alkaline non-lysosomal ceramidase N-terminal domain-containing protein [Abditibacteriaceae bacterium]
MGNEVYQAGVARADITSPVGSRLCGYTVREGLSHTVAEPLTATALALCGGETVIFLALDLTLASVELTTRLREHCARSANLPVSNILINFNHTHSAPILPGFWPHDTPDQLKMQEDYAEYLAAQLEQVCRDAISALRPARLAVGWGECKGNINRRQKADDDTVLMGENPDGPCDSSVGVVRVDNLEGQPLAVLFRYSCHTVTLGPRTNVISPDFIGPARALVERETGCLALFMQGCAGNMNPITGIGQDAEGYEDTVRLGHLLGGEVVKVCSTLRTHRRRKEPLLVQSVAVYWLYEYEPISPGGEGSVRVQEIHMQLPLTPFAPLEEIERERATWAERLSDARQRSVREAEMNVAVRFDYWSQLRLNAARNGPNPATVEFPIQVIQLGELAFVALPFEVMAETGLELRAAVPQRNTFVLGYSNGLVSYLPTPQVSRDGGMEAKLGYKNYLLPSELPGAWEPQIKERTMDLLEAINE